MNRSWFPRRWSLPRLTSRRKRQVYRINSRRSDGNNRRYVRIRYYVKECGAWPFRRSSVGLQPSEKEGTMSPYIKVIDQGHGLSEEDETQLFEPFHTTESSGTGLGLYISKELCEANHATLEYSVTNAGTSCFSIFFSQSQPATS